MPIEHELIPLGERHAHHQWEYANDAEREAATGLLETDIKKQALVLDTMKYWLLVSVGPAVWQEVNPTVLPETAEPLVFGGGEGEPTMTLTRDFIQFLLVSGYNVNISGDSMSVGFPGGGIVVINTSGIELRTNLDDNAVVATITSDGITFAGGVSPPFTYPAAGLPAAKTFIPIACGDEVTPIEVAAGVVNFRSPPFDLAVSSIEADLVFPQVSGDPVQLTIEVEGDDALTVAMEFVNGEFSAAGNLAIDTIPARSLVKINVTQVGADTVAAGLKVYITGSQIPEAPPT